MHRFLFCEVMMFAGLRLSWMLSSLFLFAAAAFTADDSQSQASSSALPAKTSSATPTAPPQAAVKPVAEMFHGTTIVDNYRWLEDGQSPATQKWVEEETVYTRALLDPLPGRDAIHKRLTELLSIGDVTPPQMAGRHYFYTKREGIENQPVLYVRDGGISGKEPGPDRVLVDPNQLNADGTVALDWWQPSDNGKYVAYGTSPGGSEMSTLHIIETKTGTVLPDTIDRTRAASIAWEHDNRGFYYTRYPKKSDVPEGQEVYNRHVFYHELGTDPDGDDPIFGEGRDPEDWPNVSLSNDGRWLLITVEQGYTKIELFLMNLKAGTPPTRVTTGKNFLYSGEVYEGKLYITTNEDAPRYRAFVTDAGDYERDHWKEIIPQTDAILLGTSVFGGKLFAQYEQNATSQLKIFDLGGKKLADLSLPALGTVFDSGGRWDRDEFFYGFQSFTFAPSIYRYDLKDNSTSLWTKVAAPSIDPSAYEVRQEWFQSKDGTRVPMFIVGKKGLQKNGHNPALVTGYGGFNISLTPAFNRAAYLWLEHGGIYAVANLRGGAEFGEDWHRAGMLDKKQNVFDDMIAAAEHLISEKYTDRNHLAIQGGSNGGLLMGAMITQRPDLFRAVVCRVPLLDMLNYQNFQIARLWIAEYGSAENVNQFKWLYAYSPYHHVKASTEYPAILFMTADTDTRVDPMHARKMAARMQAEAKNGASRTRPILLRVETKAGHGAGKPVTKQIEEYTDIYSFLFWQVGVKE
ncbi:Prolyl oligopeptidase [Candidatus Sulfotelmatobacter kueseliae]|uniref:prolyl oligopeptidase n=1 Tax=Candidatus Sulfotelmatobacter kueseliae TaxID=2042962 RepID=A0A2U3KNW5_9BACT|nr:Prolyl oligopeptidase [Candidatus Sulfotelmatobacter kueseliae]